MNGRQTLESIVKQHVALDPVTSTGWQPVLCKICNDRGHKGKRAAFKFDQNKAAYNCFNCGHAAVYDPDENRTMPKKMVTVLEAFDIPEHDWQQLLFYNLGKDAPNEKTKRQVQSFEPQPIDLPDFFYPLSQCEDHDKWGVVAKIYLHELRGIDYNDYPFYLAKKTNDPASHKWCKRVIVPVYKNGNLVYYFGRDLTGQSIKKYESPSITRSNVIYGFDRLFDMDERPLYIVEGWFDAFSIDGVAIFGNQLTDGQKYWLNKSRKKKVYIPDRLGNGALGAKQAIDCGWSISTPDIGDCKDMNEAVMKYGKLYVLKEIADKTASGFAAQVNIGIYCE